MFSGRTVFYHGFPLGPNKWRFIMVFHSAQINGLKPVKYSNKTRTEHVRDIQVRSSPVQSSPPPHSPHQSVSHCAVAAPLQQKKRGKKETPPNSSNVGATVGRRRRPHQRGAHRRRAPRGALPSGARGGARRLRARVPPMAPDPELRAAAPARARRPGHAAPPRRALPGSPRDRPLPVPLPLLLPRGHRRRPRRHRRELPQPACPRAAELQRCGHLFFWRCHMCCLSI